MEKHLLTTAERFARQRSIKALAGEIIELAGHLNAANYRFLKLIAEFDRCEGWGGDGATHSCAHWLNWQCGIAMGAAREKVRTARALQSLPKISAAMERGQLSYSKVRALTRVASEATEDTLINVALNGTAHHVETVVRHLRRCMDTEALSKEEQQQKTRHISYYWDDDGSLVFRARLPAETGALLLKAIEGAADVIHGTLEEMQKRMREDAKAAHAAGRDYVPRPTNIDNPNRTMQKADGLGLLAESFLKHGAAEMNGGDRHQIIIHVDAQTLKDSRPGQCEIDDGPGVPAETVRRLACDASIVAIVEDENGEPLSVGRKTRSIPPALQRALNSRDQGCRFPGCTHKKYTDAHHIQHWAHGGETKMSNLVTLCRFHHRKVHEGQVIVQVLDDGAIRFVQPDGESFDGVARNHTGPIGDWRQLPVVHERAGIHITAKTAATRWDGGPMEYGLAMDALMWLRRDVSAET